jgi:hypothetical protein
MPARVQGELVEPATRILLGGIDVDDGPTAAQLTVLGTIVAHLWARPDLDLTTMQPMTPPDAARAIGDFEVRRRLIQLMVTLELCRHPQTADQISRVEEYAGAFEVDGPALGVIRDWIDKGVEFATADYDRSYANVLPELSEPTLRDVYLTLTEPDPDLARRLQELHELPEGTLGYWYLEFYRRNNFVIPGADIHFPAHYVSHDMNHVITGYEPTGTGELALGAFTLAMNDNDANWLQFMTNLFIHEAGMLKHGEIMPNPEALERPGATELLGEALERGAHCTADFSQTDHLALAALPLDDVRAQFNVTPLATPMF